MQCPLLISLLFGLLGYIFSNGSNDTCVSLDECVHRIYDPCGHKGRCINTDATYICICDEGWTRTTDSMNATCDLDIDECEETPGICQHVATCVNLNDNFVVPNTTTASPVTTTTAATTTTTWPSTASSLKAGHVHVFVSMLLRGYVWILQ